MKASKLLGLLAMTLAMCTRAGAACSVGVGSALAFGNYDVFSSQDLLGVGSVEVTCDQAFSIALSSGNNSNDYHARRMLGPSGSLFYNLYSDVNRQILWADSSDPAHTVSGAGTGQLQSFDVYGLIPALQNVPVGSYVDTIFVLVTF